MAFIKERKRWLGSRSEGACARATARPSHLCQVHSDASVRLTRDSISMCNANVDTMFMERFRNSALSSGNRLKQVYDSQVPRGATHSLWVSISGLKRVWEHGEVNARRETSTVHQPLAFRSSHTLFHAFRVAPALLPRCICNCRDLYSLTSHELTRLVNTQGIIIGRNIAAL